MTAGLLLTLAQPGREARDRLELLTALIAGPSFDPLFRPDVIQVPRDHAALHWNCLVAGCDGQIYNQEMCQGHVVRWREQRAAGVDRLEYLRTAPPVMVKTWLRPPAGCRVPGCRRPGQRRAPADLCTFHRNRLTEDTGSTRIPEAGFFRQWLAGQEPRPSYGGCAAACCACLARSPLGLCEEHEGDYRKAACPGGAALPRNWARWHDCDGLPVPVTFDDGAAFRRWCAQARPAPRPGQLSVFGMAPLMKAELKWCLFAYTRRTDHTRWWMHAIQRILAACQELHSLEGLDVAPFGQHERVIVTEMRQDLQSIFTTPSSTREAGYIDLEHFGRRVAYLNPMFDLTLVRQRWLRDLLWDYLAAQLRSVDCPRARNTFYVLRVAAQELGAFLELEASGGGHDPSVLEPGHAERFAADQRRRALGKLPALRDSYNSRPPVVTEVTSKATLDALRKIMRWALEAGHDEMAGLDRAFILAFPPGGKPAFRPRSPFTDGTARALADPANLDRLAETDPNDRGIRDIWETIIATGRRAGEVLRLHLDCVGLHNGVPLLWHDQTKVGSFNEAIRIPDYTYRLLQQRQATTLTRYEQRYGRLPDAEQRAAMALFPRGYKNPFGHHAVTNAWFNERFHAWVLGLELGPAVPHQARHTLATRLLAAGASLQHIKRYLGHVSERMTEHYAKVALSEIDDVLQHVWVAGPGAARPGEALSAPVIPMPAQQARALALDLGRHSTPTEGGVCTFQVVVDGGACPWKLDCHNCGKFVMTGADLLYWRRKREQWHSLAERAPDDATADYLHGVFEPTARAIDGLEKALAGLGLLDDALALDMRRPQDYFHRLWATGFRTADLAAAGGADQETQ